MDVRIGVTQSPKEVELELGDDIDAQTLQDQINEVLNRRSGGEGAPVLWLTDKLGRTIGVPAEKIAFVEIGADSSKRRVGFVG